MPETYLKQHVNFHLIISEWLTKAKTILVQVCFNIDLPP